MTCSKPHFQLGYVTNTDVILKKPHALLQRVQQTLGRMGLCLSDRPQEQHLSRHIHTKYNIVRSNHKKHNVSSLQCMGKTTEKQYIQLNNLPTCQHHLDIRINCLMQPSFLDSVLGGNGLSPEAGPIQLILLHCLL